VRKYIKFLEKVSKKRAAKFVTKLFLTPQRKVLRADQLDYYNSGHTEFIRFNDKDVFVFSKGEGPRVMLTHGWGSNSYLFRYIIDALVDTGYSVVTIDYPAHGQSSGSHTTLVETSELVYHISKMYGPIEAIIAYSFGGPTTLRAMELGVEIKSLVLLSAPTKIESIFDPFFELLTIPPNLQKRFVDELVSRTGINRNGISPMDMNFDKSMRTLIIHDKNDEIISYNDAENIYREMPNSKLILTENLGHRGVPRNGDVIPKITDFITGSDLKITV
jgi:pimeloyl-ACP methyl ester carboxylesterase